MKCPYRMIVVRVGSPPIMGFQNKVESRIEWPDCLKVECPFYENIAQDKGRGGIEDHCIAAESRMPMPGTLPKYASPSKN